MQFPRSSLLCFSLLAILSSCAKEKNATPTAEGAATAKAYIVPAENLAVSQMLAKGAVVTCAPGATCSPTVGLLSFAMEDGAAQCTASLVAPDIIATNAHCVPDDLQKAGASCADRMWMNFIPSSTPGFETQIACDRVLIAKGAGEQEAADYAFIKLAKPSNRPTFRVSRGGFADNEMFKLEKVDPVHAKGQMRGEQKEVNCRAVQHSVLAPKFTSNLHPVPLMSECLVIHGNSGSAIRSLDGTVRGVIYATLDVAKLPEAFAKGGIAIDGNKVTYMGLGSNYACLELPDSLGAPSMPAACATAQGAPNQSEARMEADTAAQMNNYAKANFSTQAGFRWFKWSIRQMPDATIEMVPSCVNTQVAELNKEAPVGLLTFKPSVKLDQYTRYKSATLAPLSTVPAKATIVSASAGTYNVSVDGQTGSLKACQ